ncbi:MAG: ATP-binding protein [Planctomycetota bacterium]
MAMNLEELRAAILAGEGREVEFKRGLPNDQKTARSLCAFANTRGGLLFIGVGDHGELIGAPHPELTAKRLALIAAQQIVPALAPLIESVVIDGVTIIAVRVAASRSRPHAVLRDAGVSEIVVRSGSSNRAASKATSAALRNTRRSKSILDAFERSVLDYLGSVKESDPNGGATVGEFARERNVGVQRSKRAFLRLEREGFVLGFGIGSGRRFRAL